MFKYLKLFFFSSTTVGGMCNSIWGDWEHELITGVEWTNQKTRNAIFGVVNVMKSMYLITC